MSAVWFVRPPALPDPECRVFCLPYAGGSASVFRLWARFAPRGVEVCPVELPGRGTRFGERSYVRMDELVADLAASMEPLLDRPYSIFGHSMGGLVGFELTRRLRAIGAALPEHLIVSAAADPAAARAAEHPVHLASDGVLKEKLRSLNGTPEGLLEDDELMDLMMPMIRADFALLETYRYRVEDPLSVPLTVLGGTLDRSVSRSGLTGWSRLSETFLDLRMFEGDHFFLHRFGPELVSVVTERVRGALRV